MSYIVELEKDVWIAPWKSDPGRTLVKENAEVFDSLIAAGAALAKARKYHPFENAEINDLAPLGFLD